MWIARYFLESVKNLFRWLPVIWTDRQYDHYFVYRIMLQKIFMMRKYHEKRQFFVGWENEVKWMRVCESLLTDITEGNYWKDEYDNKPLNVRNVDCENYLKETCTPSIAQEDFMIGGVVVEAKGHDTSTGFRAEVRDIKAEALLFKILAWRIKYWWD